MQTPAPKLRQHRAQKQHFVAKGAIQKMLVLVVDIKILEHIYRKKNTICSFCFPFHSSSKKYVKENGIQVFAEHHIRSSKFI